MVERNQCAKLMMNANINSMQLVVNLGKTATARRNYYCKLSTFYGAIIHHNYWLIDRKGFFAINRVCSASVRIGFTAIMRI